MGTNRMNAEQRRHVRLETLIATCLCSVLPSLAVLFLYEPFPVPLWGADGLVAFAAKSTGVAVLLMTTLMTLGTRSKVAKGGIAPVVRDQVEWLRLVPRQLALRAPLFAIACAALLTLATLVFVLLADPAPLGKPAFVVFNLVIGGLIGLLMTPRIQCAAMADAVRPVRSPSTEGV